MILCVFGCCITIFGFVDTAKGAKVPKVPPIPQWWVDWYQAHLTTPTRSPTLFCKSSEYLSDCDCATEAVVCRVAARATGVTVRVEATSGGLTPPVLLPGRAAATPTTGRYERLPPCLYASE